MNKKYYILILLILLIAPQSLSATKTMCASGCDYTTLAGAFAGISGGDTLIIKDGTYIGTNNQISYNNLPPSGNAMAYTVIKAENPGNVTFDGQGARTMFDFYAGTSNDYIEVYGLQFVNRSSDLPHSLTGSADNNRSATYWKFKRCGFEDNIQVNYASYILLEDCYVTGNGRYNFLIFCSDHVLVRRCIARLDNAEGDGMPIANFCDYASQQVEFQNCISIDSDDDYFSNFSGLVGSFYIRKGYTSSSGIDRVSTDAKMRGNIILNVHFDRAGVSTGWPGFGGIVHAGDSSGHEFVNNIVWSSHNGGFLEDSAKYAYTMDHMTFGITGNGNSNYYSFIQGNSIAYGDITNSIFYGSSGTAVQSVKTLKYNDFYNNSTNKSNVGSSTGDLTNNPLTNHLKYLPRIEVAPGLDGNDNKKMGATILYKYGVDGTMWGEAGYNTLTTDALWPFPNESIIKTFFIKNGASTNPSPTRGFATGNSIDETPQTLTKYIWEYLGNEIPADIYGEEEPECDSSHLELCTTEEICSGASLNWCDDACQVEECEEPPAATAPISGVVPSGVRFSM